MSGVWANEILKFLYEANVTRDKRSTMFLLQQRFNLTGPRSNGTANSELACNEIRLKIYGSGIYFYVFKRELLFIIY